MKKCILVCSLVLGLSVWATPSVTLHRFQQRYPWNGNFDIDYTIADMGQYPEDYRLEFSVSAETDAGTKVFAPSNFFDWAACDLPVTDGTYRVTWDAAADGAVFRSKNVTVTANLVYAPVTDADASYMILDLSGGPAAERYPIKYVAGEIDSSQFNKTVYKTSRLVMKKVPHCSFWMGEGSNGNIASTKRHYVTLTEDFFLGLFPVTQAQYLNVCGVQPPVAKGYKNYYGDLKPVYDITWNNINGIDMTDPAFLPQLRVKATYHDMGEARFDLPTESQRECACRAGTLTAYPWGANDANDADRYLWSSSNSGLTLKDVGLKLPNPWGFYDICGLISEWVYDWKADYPTGTEESPDINPKGPDQGAAKILRGANCFHVNSANANSGYRTYAYVPTTDRVSAQHYVFGFRLALTLSADNN